MFPLNLFNRTASKSCFKEILNLRQSGYYIAPRATLQNTIAFKLKKFNCQIIDLQEINNLLKLQQRRQQFGRQDGAPFVFDRSGPDNYN